MSQTKLSAILVIYVSLNQERFQGVRLCDVE